MSSPQWAAAHGLPVAAMRVITDPAERTLPASAVAAMRPNGTTNIGAMIRAMLMRPREIPALISNGTSTHLQPGQRWCGDGVCSVLVSCSSIPLKATQ